MGFLIRSAFWLSLVLLLIPFGTGAGDLVGPIQAFSAAREAVGDITGICERKPDVCLTGKAALHTIGTRAREASRIALEALDETSTESAAGTDATTTGTVVVKGFIPQPRPDPIAR